MKTKSLKKSCVFLATLIFLLSLGNCSKNPGWSRFRGPRGDGISTETKWNPKALDSGAKILWKANIGTGHSNVVFKNGRLYTMGQPAYAELVVYCLDAKTGEVRWQKDLLAEYDIMRPHYGFSTSPIVEGDLVLLNLNFAGIALDKRSGKKVWISEKYHPSKIYLGEKDQVGYAMPVPYDRDGKRYLMLFNCTGIHCVDIKSGNEL